MLRKLKKNSKLKVLELRYKTLVEKAYNFKYTNLCSEFVVDKEFSGHLPHLPAKKDFRIAHFCKTKLYVLLPEEIDSFPFPY